MLGSGARRIILCRTLDGRLLAEVGAACPDVGDTHLRRRATCQSTGER